jgi:hypothetical protein
MLKHLKIRKPHVLIALGIAALSIVDVFYLLSINEKLSKALHDAAIVALLLILVELLVILILEQDDFLNYARRAVDRDASEIVRFEDFADKDGTLLGRLGREAVKVFLRSYRFSPRHYLVIGHEEVINSYVVFWQYLVERQRRERSSIGIKVVHSLDIEIWNNDKMKLVMEKQAEFIRDGGNVTRILISSEEQPGESYMAVIREMIRRKITTRFARKNEFAHDFLVAPSLGIAVNWTGTVRASRILQIEYIIDLTEQEQETFSEMWEAGDSGAVDAVSFLT